MDNITLAQLPQGVIERITRALPTGRNRTALSSVSRSLRINVPAQLRSQRITRPRWIRSRRAVRSMPRLDVVFFCTRILRYNPVPSLIPWVEGSLRVQDDAERYIINHVDTFQLFSAVSLFLYEIPEYFNPIVRGTRSIVRRPEPSGYHFQEIITQWNMNATAAQQLRRLSILRGRMDRNASFRRAVMTIVLPFLRHVIRSMRQAGLVNAQMPTNKQQALVLYQQWNIIGFMGLGQGQLMPQILTNLLSIPSRREILMILVRFIHIEL